MRKVVVTVRTQREQALKEKEQQEQALKDQAAKEQAQKEQAAKELEASLRLNPEQAGALSNLAQIRFESGDLRAAQSLFEKAAALASLNRLSPLRLMRWP